MAKLNFNSIMIGTGQLKKMGMFYEKILEKKSDMAESEWYGWKVGSCFLSIGAHSEVKGKAKEPQRVILNMETATVKEEFERMKAIGAGVVKAPYQMQGVWIATLSDPDGNYFQLMEPWEGK